MSHLIEISIYIVLSKMFRHIMLQDHSWKVNWQLQNDWLISITSEMPPRFQYCCFVLGWNEQQKWLYPTSNWIFTMPKNWCARKTKIRCFSSFSNVKVKYLHFFYLANKHMIKWHIFLHPQLIAFNFCHFGIDHIGSLILIEWATAWNKLASTFHIFKGSFPWKGHHWIM